jgi:hypothetical protein
MTLSAKRDELQNYLVKPAPLKTGVTEKYN